MPPLLHETNPTMALTDVISLRKLYPFSFFSFLFSNSKCEDFCNDLDFLAKNPKRPVGKSMSVDKDDTSTSSSAKVRPRTPAQVKADSAARKAKVIINKLQLIP